MTEPTFLLKLTDISRHQNFLKEFPVFDLDLSEGVIYGLICTTQWRKSLDIFDSMKELKTPSSRIYSAVIHRAIQDEDEPLVWNLFDNMIAECTVLQNEVFVSYIGFCEKNSHTFAEKINKMLTFIKDNEILVTTEVANEFQRAFQMFGYNCSITAIAKQ